jgi:choline monooxygenase
LNGELRGAPEFGKEICREQFNLPELEVATFGNLIFVKDKSVKGLNIINFMSPVDNVPDYTFYARKTYELRCNWKVYVDNYLDGGYHVNYIHPGLAEVVDYKHYHTKLYDNTNVQISPLNAGSSTRKGTAYYWWIFPNLMINIYDGVMDTNHVFPLSPDRCLVAMDFYFQDMSPFQRSESIGIADKIQDEDVKICENVQLGLKSRSYESGRFCVKREAGAYHFHKLLSRKLYG